MKDLATYPISFPYGSTAPPYTSSHPHRGDDRACPANTPVIIQGVTVGLVGMTGWATGYHCHIQEWLNSKTNVRKPQNAFKGGTVTEVDPVGNTGDGSWGKYVTISNDDGWNSSYCHLNEVKVAVGDKIKEGGQVSNPIDVLRMIAGEVQGFDAEVYNGKYDAMLMGEWGNDPLETVVREAFNRAGIHRYQLAAENDALKKQVENGEYIKTEVYVKKEK